MLQPACWKKGIIISVLVVCSVFTINAQSITIQGTQFYSAPCNKRVWFNGVNTPWNSWNDFGGNFNRDWWNTHFQTLKNKGINCSRIWISCDGNGAVLTDSSGVTGLPTTFFNDCDSLFSIAQRNGQLPVSDLQRFVAMCAVAVHNSSVPVTVGSACIKWNSNGAGLTDIPITLTQSYERALTKE